MPLIISSKSFKMIVDLIEIKKSVRFDKKKCGKSYTVLKQVSKVFHILHLYL